MPGHKRNMNFIPKNLGQLDMTEIPGMDVLSAPTGVLADLQEKITSFYGANKSFLLVNGSSGGIIAAICATCINGTTLIAPRNAHISVYNGMVISGARPAYILPEITNDGLAGGVSSEVFNDMPIGAVVLVVSPTYEGFVSDIAAIAKKVHQRKGVLIVDEAHGAHFTFDKYFPSTALSLGADIVINSLHKTLPALSQSAVLHVKSSSVDVSRLSFYINAVQTSSPSYILMAACDFMLRKLWSRPSIFEEYISQLIKLRKSLVEVCEDTALSLSGRERVGDSAIYDVDLGKLLFTANADCDAEEISAIMADKHKIQMEMAKGRHLLAMTSVADTHVGFERLKTAVSAICELLPMRHPEKNTKYTPYLPDLPEVVLTPIEAVRRETEMIPISEAVGRISGEIITEYPPGIALIAPGERISMKLFTPYLRSNAPQMVRVIK